MRWPRRQPQELRPDWKAGILFRGNNPLIRFTEGGTPYTNLACLSRKLRIRKSLEARLTDSKQSRAQPIHRQGLRRATLLIKLEPGTAFLGHDHSDVEECLVLEGDLELGGKVMHRFDSMRIPKGGQHCTPRTINGCIVLVTCGLAA